MQPAHGERIVRRIHVDRSIDPREFHTSIRNVNAAITHRRPSANMWMVGPAAHRKIQGEASGRVAQLRRQRLHQRKIHAVGVHTPPERVLRHVRRKEGERERVTQRRVENRSPSAQHVRLDPHAIARVAPVHRHQLGGQSGVFELVRRCRQRHRRLRARASNDHVEREAAGEIGREPRQHAEIGEGHRVRAQTQPHWRRSGRFGKAGNSRSIRIRQNERVQRQLRGGLQEPRWLAKRPARNANGKAQRVKLHRCGVV